jgi:hypothetical protein
MVENFEKGGGGGEHKFVKRGANLKRG